jgi:hypothetical protein
MRMLIKASIPVEQGNASISDGSLPRVVQHFLETQRPEAVYFLTEHGRRTMLAVFDLESPAAIPVIAEPFFMHLDAAVEFTPVMNVQELQQGLGSVPHL